MRRTLSRFFPFLSSVRRGGRRKSYIMHPFCADPLVVEFKRALAVVVPLVLLLSRDVATASRVFAPLAFTALSSVLLCFSFGFSCIFFPFFSLWVFIRFYLCGCATPFLLWVSSAFLFRHLDVDPTLTPRLCLWSRGYRLIITLSCRMSKARFPCPFFYNPVLPFFPPPCGKRFCRAALVSEVPGVF